MNQDSDIGDILEEFEDLPPSPGAKATNKQVLDYLRTLINGLTKSLRKYKGDTDQKIVDINNNSKLDVENINKQYESLKKT